MAHIYAFITCTRVKAEATVEEYAKLTQRLEEEVRADFAGDDDYDEATDTIRLGEPIEEYGWIDRLWSSKVLFDSRNDATPIVSCDEDDEELASEVQAALGWLEGGHEDNGDGTFYARDSYCPFDDPWTYNYAIHFVRKAHGPKGWYEEQWHPFKDGHLMWHEGELTGPHADYPHEAGTLYDCLACEKIMDEAETQPTATPCITPPCRHPFTIKCVNGCRAAADELTRLGQEMTGGQQAAAADGERIMNEED